MDNDPIATALRRDAEMLLKLSPAPDASALWHRAQRARAQRIQRIMNMCGWGLRVAIALVFAGVAVFAPHALVELLLPLALIGWLSTGICSPAFEARRAESFGKCGLAPPRHPPQSSPK